MLRLKIIFNKNCETLSFHKKNSEDTVASNHKRKEHTVRAAKDVIVDFQLVKTLSIKLLNK